MRIPFFSFVPFELKFQYKHTGTHAQLYFIHIMNFQQQFENKVLWN